MSLPLDRIQQAFAASLADPRDVEVQALLCGGDARLGDRFALYRGNVAAAREKALGAAFPVVSQLVGEEFFAALAREYARVHPSRSGDLNRFGERFAEFVAGFEHTRSLPYLGDVAALEWQVHRAHYAADAVALARDRLGSMPAEDLLGTRFVLHPACSWLASAFPIATLWNAHRPDSGVALPATTDRAEQAIVVRPRWRVEVVASSPAEIAALDCLRRGEDMGGAIGAAMAADPAFKFAPVLVRWLDLAILVDLRAG